MHIYLWRGWGGVAGCAGTFWLMKAGYDSNTFVFIGGTSMQVSFASPLGLGNLKNTGDNFHLNINERRF